VVMWGVMGWTVYRYSALLGKQAVAHNDWFTWSRRATRPGPGDALGWGSRSRSSRAEYLFPDSDDQSKAEVDGNETFLDGIEGPAAGVANVHGNCGCSATRDTMAVLPNLVRTGLATGAIQQVVLTASSDL